MRPSGVSRSQPGSATLQDGVRVFRLEQVSHNEYKVKSGLLPLFASGTLVSAILRCQISAPRSRTSGIQIQLLKVFHSIFKHVPNTYTPNAAEHQEPGSTGQPLWNSWTEQHASLNTGFLQTSFRASHSVGLLKDSNLSGFSQFIVSRKPD